MKRAMSITLVCAGLFVAMTALRTSHAVAGAKITGEVKADGSSTVYLITEAMATSFKKLHPGVNITVGISGTGGGFKKFIAGETDIQDASRAIKPNEADQCKEKGIAYTELQVGWDGLAVIINPENTWARKMTMEQLKKIWHPDGQMTIKKWSDADPSWPAEEMKLFGAGSDSGTFDYFTEAVNGKERATRTDYTPTEDDNITVQAVSRNKYALGYPTTRKPDGGVVIDIAHPYWGPTDTNVDLSTSYSRPILGGKIRWKAQLNVRNAIGRGAVLPVTIQPWGEVATTRLAPERRWYLTNTFSF